MVNLFVKSGAAAVVVILVVGLFANGRANDHLGDLEGLKDEIAKFRSQVATDNAALTTTVENIEAHRRGIEGIDWPQFEGVYDTLTNVSKVVNSRDFHEPWYKKIVKDICESRHMHRKAWEFAVIWRSLEAFLPGFPRTGMKGLGLACGREPLTSAFVKFGCDVVVSDFPVSETVGTKWGTQHSASLEESHNKCLVPNFEDYKKHARHMGVDLNKIPAELLQGEFDFVWSAGSIEHVGSLNLSIEAFVNSVRSVRPNGGVAVHTIEFSMMKPELLYENSEMSLWRKSEVEELERRLKRVGARLIPVNYAIDRTAPADSAVDRPPYTTIPHLKLSIPAGRDSTFITTSILLVAVRDAS